MKNSHLCVETFPMGSFACNCSLVYSPVTKEALIIDPGNDLQAIEKKISERSLNVKKLLHTHAHFDHIGCSADLAQKLGATLHLHQDDLDLYNHLNEQVKWFGLPPLKPGKVDDFLQDDQEFGLTDDIQDPKLKNFLKTLFTPGHTEGSCCFFTDIFDHPLLFAGDTLFQNSIGRTDLPGGDFQKIKKSIKDRLFHLPEETIVITGHGPKTRIYEEKRYNPFVS